ncbi:cupin domain-containing protein [Aneurinibacillus sp. Ricciae_BoGa-3]|uniref:cupin domain-containing protein n=1 Tax=Aneurinibacillus sp. Ricciae_BoGa-3 TaxID=3022697 RepID=UPI00234173B3|nr:cupin domain-containing protein [Aneurinibacillus sp. Ricciae_BoGa-3]WCK52438.1 cupin domain-containing protein [Aneurinibacillus sp. Ricciae_BoGa-3]
MRALLLSIDYRLEEEYLSMLETVSGAELLRFDLAWDLFLKKAGKDSDGRLDIPAGNPRTQWFSLIHWFRHTLSPYVDMMGTAEKAIIGYLPSSTPAAKEYIMRVLSMYAVSLGSLEFEQLNQSAEDVGLWIKSYFKNGSHEKVQNAWMAPVVNPKAHRTPLLEKMSKTKGEGDFTWLTGLIGSDRLFSQMYRLKPGASGNRLHSHSGIDEMFYVIEGSGTVVFAQGEHPLREGDVITKPAGSGTATKFIAGEEGLTILDIEVWANVDQTDAVIYHEYGEAMLRGRGLNHGSAIENFFQGEKIMAHYTEFYKRERDGSLRSLSKE